MVSCNEPCYMNVSLEIFWIFCYISSIGSVGLVFELVSSIRKLINISLFVGQYVSYVELQ